MDIVVEAGETSFSPGPMVGKLQAAGIPAAIKGGKVVINQKITLVKEGEVVSAKVADILKRKNRFASDLTAFDAVTMWDTIEHLEEPEKRLKRIAKGALLFASIPVFDDLRMIRASKHYRPGEHLYYWTAQGFRLLLQLQATARGTAEERFLTSAARCGEPAAHEDTGRQLPCSAHPLEGAIGRCQGIGIKAPIRA